MGLNFRKSISILPGVKLNLSKGGVGVSAGVPGFRKSINTKGQTTTTISIPGTGLYYTNKKKVFGNKKNEKKEDKKTEKKTEKTTQKSTEKTTEKSTQKTDQSVHKGDLSGDGKINALDIIFIQRLIVGLDKVTDTKKALADINGDGKINALDIIFVQRHIVGLQKIEWK